MSNAFNDSELTPPMQTIPGEALYDTLAGEGIPRFRFAVASLTDDGQLKLTESIPVPKTREPILEDGETYTENVIQTYSVSVPYEEMVDGKTITKMRTEHRTRTVPIQRVKPKTGSEDKWETRTYTCLLYTSPSPRDRTRSRMPSSA